MNGKEYILDDHFLEIRFDPKYKLIYKEKFESLDKTSVSKGPSIPVNFHGFFNDQVENTLKTIVERVVTNASLYGLTLKKVRPAIYIYAYKVWKNENVNKSGLNLPAAVIDWRLNHPIIKLIIPDEINSNDILIKSVRLLFSKLYGTLFFNENVLLRKPFNLIQSILSETNFGKNEKLHLCRLLDEYSPSTIEKISKLTPNRKLTNHKLFALGKNAFFRTIESESNKEIEQPILGLLNEVFSYHQKTAQEKPLEFYNLVVNKIFKTIPKIGVILPHEVKKINYLRNRNKWELLVSIKERTFFVNNCIRDLIDCLIFIEKYNKNKETEQISCKYWINLLNNRMAKLKRKGQVKLFLFENSRLSANQEREKYNFPFWIWRQKFFEDYPRDMPTDVILKTITNQYRNSVYQKIFEASFRAVTCLKTIIKQPNFELILTKDFIRMKSIITGLQLRLPYIEDVLYSCDTASQLVKKTNHYIKLADLASDFERGWSYFISFALIHQFYFATKKNKADKLLKIVEKYIEKKLEQKRSFQISYLLFRLYLKQKYDLNDIIQIVKNGSDAFNYILQNSQQRIEGKASIDMIFRLHSENIVKTKL